MWNTHNSALLLQTHNDGLHEEEDSRPASPVWRRGGGTQGGHVINNDKRNENNNIFIVKEIYKKKLLPLEKESKFHEIQSPMMEDPDFDGMLLIFW